MASKDKEAPSTSSNSSISAPSNSATDVSTTTVPTGSDIASVVEEVAGAVSRAAAAAPVAAAVGGVSTDHATELGSIDFKKMIGGPLQAAVDAQVASSLATVDFIKKVGFNYPTMPDPQDPSKQVPDYSKTPELAMADFSYKKKDKDGNETTVDIKVPLLVMLQIPSLRIDYVDIKFNVKLNSVETAKVSDKLGIDASVQGGWGPVSFKVSASYQRQSSSGVEVKKEYSLSVDVKAVQDEIPPGLEKILGLLAA